MNHIGLNLGPDGFKVFKMPPLSPQALENFSHLPQDPYYKERWRQFSQYIMFYEDDNWACKVLKHKNFIQSKAYNHKVGGVPRKLEPITDVDPTMQFRELAMQLGFSKNDVFQVNLHQWRTRVSDQYKGNTIPEGAHRDGHHITSVTVWNRKGITGGASVLYPVGKSEPFFKTELAPGECLVMRDEDMIHGADDIYQSSEEEGFRDIWVISINPWSDRRYGDRFDWYATGQHKAWA